MYAPKGGVAMAKYDPQECLQTFKGKTFTCLSLSLPPSECCSFCRNGGVSRQAAREAEETAHYERQMEEIEPELWAADEIMRALEI